MLEFLKGTVICINDDSFILDMGSTGFEISSSRNTIDRIMLNNECCIYTKLYVKEDEVQLFGFAAKEERKMFCLLTSVSGVGPKAALAILSSFSPEELAMCIVREDIDSLTKVRGIGKKNAGRLILELKDKLKKNRDIIDTAIKDVSHDLLETNEIGEAFNALVVLGYSERDIKGVISGVYKQGMSVEDILRESLKIM